MYVYMYIYIHNWQILAVILYYLIRSQYLLIKRNEIRN